MSFVNYPKVCYFEHNFPIERVRVYLGQRVIPYNLHLRFDILFYNIVIGNIHKSCPSSFTINTFDKYNV